MSQEHQTLDALFKSLEKKFKKNTSGQIEDAYGEQATANEAKQYVITPEAKEALSFFANGAFQTLEKPITSASAFVGLADKVNSEGDITMSSPQLMYVAELYSQLTYKTLEEAKTFCNKHASFTPLYNEQYEDQMRLKFIAQIAKQRASEELMGNLPKENGDTTTEDLNTGKVLDLNAAKK